MKRGVHRGKPDGRIVLLILLGVFLAIFLLWSIKLNLPKKIDLVGHAMADGSDITRSFNSSNIKAGDTVEVRLTVAIGPQTHTYYVIEENITSGWLVHSNWSSSNYNIECSGKDYQAGNCALGVKACDISVNQWCFNQSGWSSNGYCANCSQYDSDCAASGPCLNDTCDTSSNQWCNGGIWTSANYQSRCGRQDSEYCVLSGGICSEPCVTNTCDVGQNKWCNASTQGGNTGESNKIKWGYYDKTAQAPSTIYTYKVTVPSAGSYIFKGVYEIEGMPSESNIGGITTVTVSGGCIPVAEVCDGVDNDCDTQIDEGLTAPLNSKQSGVCAGSVKRCAGTSGWVDDYSGVAYYQDPEGTCDNRDNDCDGLTDEPFTNESCEFICKSNRYNWTNSSRPGLSCCGNNPFEDNPYQKLINETFCDGNDNNCDATTDEWFSGEGCQQKCFNLSGKLWNSTPPIGAEKCCGDNEAYQNPETSYCDYEDNDCDGIIDEMKSSDVNNCGSCGYKCNLTHVVIHSCTLGVCRIGQCESGWSDLNLVPADGCESPCVPTNGGVEICDGIDNDCDYITDEGFTTETCSFVCMAQNITDNNNYNSTRGSGFKCCGDNSTEGHPFYAVEAFCDGRDNDCDGSFDEGFNDTDGDHFGDDCDADDDNDGIPDGSDNCRLISNINQLNTDNDSFGDVCDNCKFTKNDDQADTDKDGTGDACETDADNDGISDEIDYILGNSSNIQSNKCVKFSVNSVENPKSYSGVATVLLKECAGKDITLFDYNFTNQTRLNLGNIKVNINSASNAGSVVLSGIDLSGQGRTKTIYFDNLNNKTSVCLRDSDVSSISEITSLCNGAREYPIKCPAVNGNYDCTFTSSFNQTFKITGLSYSGAQQQSYCGDGNCDSVESCSTCSDCGACPSSSSSSGGGGSGGGGGGGGGSGPCKEDWICGSWSVCDKNGQQSRDCYDNKKCGTTTKKPATIDSCEYLGTCSDGLMNSNEEGVDCGGRCGKLCAALTETLTSSVEVAANEITGEILGQYILKVTVENKGGTELKGIKVASKKWMSSEPSAFDLAPGASAEKEITLTLPANPDYDLLEVYVSLSDDSILTIKSIPVNLIVPQYTVKLIKDDATNEISSIVIFDNRNNSGRSISVDYSIDKEEELYFTSEAEKHSVGENEIYSKIEKIPLQGLPSGQYNVKSVFYDKAKKIGESVTYLVIGEGKKPFNVKILVYSILVLIVLASMFIFYRAIRRGD